MSYSVYNILKRTREE